MADAKPDDKDELADALAAMGGSQGSSPFPDDVVEMSDGAASTPTSDGKDPSSTARPQRPVRPGMPVARPGSPVASSAPIPTLKPPPGQSARSAQPAPINPSVGVPPNAPTSRPAKPGAPKPADARPARPLAPSVAAPPPPTAPVVPFLPGVAEPAITDASADGFVTDDEDDFVMPAPMPETFQPRGVAKVKPKWEPSMTFRRTIIPLCLTSSVIAVALAVGWFAVDPASIFRRTGVVMPITLFVIGLVMLVLGILNMLAVRAELRRSSAAASS